jgi:hypothetical protein
MGGVCSTHERRPEYKFWSGNLKEEHHLGDLGKDGGQNKKHFKEIGYEDVWLRRGTRVGSCEHGNETSGSGNGGEFLCQRSNMHYSRRTLIHGASWLLNDAALTARLFRVQ